MAITADDLPRILAEIARAIGLPDTLKLVEQFGGTLLYIPRRPEKLPARHPLLQLVGLDAARKLASLFGCERVLIPMASRALSGRLRRNVAIEADHQHLSIAQLARKYSLHERSIRRILARPRSPARPGSAGRLVQLLRAQR